MTEPAEQKPSTASVPTTLTTDTPSLLGGTGTPSPEDVADATEESGETATPEAEEEQYSFDFSAVELPEGITVTEEQQTEFTDLAVKHKITPEAAKDLFALYGAQGAAQAETIATALKEQTTVELQTLWKDTNEGWVTATKTEFGADQPAVLTRIGNLINEFGDQEVRQAFDVTGAGNHPAVVRMLNRLAVAVGEGTPVNPSGQPDADENPLFKIYPSMAPTKG